jgi:hypothetical protein
LFGYEKGIKSGEEFIKKNINDALLKITARMCYQVNKGMLEKTGRKR